MPDVAGHRGGAWQRWGVRAAGRGRRGSARARRGHDRVRARRRGELRRGRGRRCCCSASWSSAMFGEEQGSDLTNQGRGTAATGRIGCSAKGLALVPGARYRWLCRRRRGVGARRGEGARRLGRDEVEGADASGRGFARPTVARDGAPSRLWRWRVRGRRRASGCCCFYTRALGLRGGGVDPRRPCPQRDTRQWMRARARSRRGAGAALSTLGGGGGGLGELGARLGLAREGASLPGPSRPVGVLGRAWVLA